MTLRLNILSSIATVDSNQWNALVQDANPFLQHGFLAALEHHGCVGETFGWLPRHIAVFEGSELVAAMPLYEKYNSYGEFVFDQGWANAYQQQGLHYFPKLVSAIPYTPASGQRCLVQAGREAELYPLLFSAVTQVAEALQASSFHCLFAVSEQQAWFQQQGLLTRHDCQFHWYNQNYACFDDFLATLTAKKRKNLKQERRKVQDAGVQLRLLDGNTASAADWERFAFFYRHTFESKWGVPTLNVGFFQTMAQVLGEQVVLVVANNAAGECIAGSLMFRSASRLYGRHWGCTEYVDSLHFEACYYQGIEYCIRHGLQVFEPGAQGEHKVPRGFVPTLTRSSHWLRDDTLHTAIARHAAYEREAVAQYMASVQTHSPYRPEVTPSAYLA
ncbi:GNAT family N-acetyltransferase [Candidatus Thiothrix anitrata]|uniref:N-acetyltransferase n=1 Tax=Candidatus Thiothrix anitrata TaxID=2823902 RepID=A0ABX7X4F5_9GAMM|nr:GNAT family N-acetyltransferase [Candidatus Thiothrix anitrata]QTR50771.1 N-acetyltransferase [Candidatus Thiothrix anitrata]